MAAVPSARPGRTSYLRYSVGWTMHVNGPQIIRTAAILQTLLGNIGRPVGGIVALRGHNNVQGATDVSTLYKTLPGYRIYAGCYTDTAISPGAATPVVSRIRPDPSGMVMAAQPSCRLQPVLGQARR